MSFVLKIIYLIYKFYFEKGSEAWVSLFIYFLLIFYYLYSFVIFFTS
jgi:hypothetical protein